MKKPRIVVDTNVWVSSFFGGYPKAVLMGLEKNWYELLISKEIVYEFERVLKSVLKKDPAVDELIAYLCEKAIMVNPDIKISIIQDDLTDNKFLECAVAGKADYIISGDKKHVLPLGEYAGIPILNPKSFIEHMNTHI
jgi:putative PIN family toxin of toxin-antitoxin system